MLPSQDSVMEQLSCSIPILSPEIEAVAGIPVINVAQGRNRANADVMHSTRSRTVSSFKLRHITCSPTGAP
jgi:hypothetical protein